MPWTVAGTAGRSGCRYPTYRAAIAVAVRSSSPGSSDSSAFPWFSQPRAWSRRIADEHRLVYLGTESEIIVLAARYHY